MCGIAGVVKSDRSGVDVATITRMTDVIAHRGPDGQGAHHEPGMGFGHRRLKIIDLAGGAQPMCNETGDVWVTFNGEIYNHRQLRQELQTHGHRFKSICDTEVLVHGYESWGQGMLSRLRGMYAFAIWDGPRQRCLLARDRMGQKPLFYAITSRGDLVFGSEAKSVVAHPEVSTSVSERGLAAYLTFEYLPGDLSIFEGVRKLPPAHCLRFDSGTVKIEAYWDLPFDVDVGRYRRRAQRNRAAGRFLDLFDRAVERRLMSDVPLGVFLSGGIDSSAIAAAVVRHRPPKQVKTFSIGFEDASFDESSVARRTAQHLGTDHHERIFSAATLLDTLPKVLKTLDEPFGDASLLPTYLLSSFTRESVTVALGGDGGDELLMGYPTFKADRAARIYSRLPATFRRMALRRATGLAVDTRNFSREFIIKSFLRVADAPENVRHPLWLGSFVPGGADDPLRLDRRRRQSPDSVLAPAVAAWNQGPHCHMQRLSYQYCKTYLAEDILHKVDRASMAVSLEARSPFLDTDLVTYITSLPAQLKLRHGTVSKWVLRRAFDGRLPAEVLTRKKKGFGIPMAVWLKGPLRAQLTDLLAHDRIKRAGFFRPEVVSRLVDEHLKGRRDNRKQLWTLLNFEFWREQYGL